MIKHAELIRAVLDGNRVQKAGDWVIYEGTHAIEQLLASKPHESWSVKPAKVVDWVPIYPHDSLGPLCGRICYGPSRPTKEGALFARDLDDYPALAPVKVMRLELDPETLDIINATTEAP
jgi:hypothetical protein